MAAARIVRGAICVEEGDHEEHIGDRSEPNVTRTARIRARRSAPSPQALCGAREPRKEERGCRHRTVRWPAPSGAGERETHVSRWSLAYEREGPHGLLG